MSRYPHLLSLVMVDGLSDCSTYYQKARCSNLEKKVIQNWLGWLREIRPEMNANR